MIARLMLAIAALVAIGAATVPQIASGPQPWSRHAPVAMANSLKPVSAFAGIKDPQARSVALFNEAGKVLLHPYHSACHLNNIVDSSWRC